MAGGELLEPDCLKPMLVEPGRQGGHLKWDFRPWGLMRGPETMGRQPQAEVLLYTDLQQDQGSQASCVGLTQKGEVPGETGQGRTSWLPVPWSSPSVSGRVGVATQRSWLAAQRRLL